MSRYLTPRLLECADNVRDMGQRVVNNGGEPNYSGEKMHSAVESALRILDHVGYTRDDVIRIVDFQFPVKP